MNNTATQSGSDQNCDPAQPYGSIRPIHHLVGRRWALSAWTHEALEMGGHQGLEANETAARPLACAVPRRSHFLQELEHLGSRLCPLGNCQPVFALKRYGSKGVKEGKNAGKPAPEYNPRMARGWESKSVEAQVEESFASTAEKRRVLSAEDLQREHKRTELTLSRHHVAEQLEQSTNERYSEMLRRALADLDAQIAKLAA